MGLNRKAIYFATDALLAALLILGGFLFIYRTATTQQPTEHIDYLSKDLLTALDAIPVTAIDHPFVQQEIANGNITKNRSVLEQIAHYWARGESAKASTLSAIALNGTLPPGIGMRLTLKDDLLYEQGANKTGNLVASRRMISGVDQGKPLEGSSSYGYLRSIKDKKTSAYAYFGGFVGQGNITAALEPLPQDVNSSRIRLMLLQADFQRYFTISINGAHCQDLSPSPGNMSAEQWNITTCKDLLTKGTNNVTISFDSLNDAYIGGGFLRVDYETDEFQSNKTYGVERYGFPRIEGIINLFDAIHVPGELNSMTIYLHYLANHTNISNNTLYLTIGNTTVYTDTNSTDTVTATIDDTQLSSILNYSLMSRSTVPLRLGFENLTYSTFFTGNADVVLITDVSGSMDWNFTDDSSYSTRRNCDNPLINDLSTQRLSVAKCLDKDFSRGILNVTGNSVGLVSYDSYTDSVLGITTDQSSIDDEIGMGVGTPYGYQAGGSTCICCGINSAYDLLSADLSATTIIPSQATWNYSNSSLKGDIPRDAQNRTWYDPDYALETGWPQGQAVLGHDAGAGGVAIDTEIGSNLTGTDQVVDLWELAADKATPEVDFTSGLNSTANTYGLGAGNDGWDWSSGTYEYPDGFDWYGVWDGRLLMRTPSSGTYDTSGSFAVTVNITPQQYEILQHNGTAELSFDYWWDDYNNYYENNDQVWLKGRWTSPYSGSHLLGQQLDAEDNHGDATPEIDTRDNPNLDIVGEHYSQSLGTWIEGPGLYYLELGGKLHRSASNEWGYFLYDNILLTTRNNTDHYYFRKHFTIDDLSKARRGVLNILADDSVKAYLNGNLITDDAVDYNGTYWDLTGLSVPGKSFRQGDNVLAVELANKGSSARFDLELIGINDSKEKAMMVMTDGAANYECGRQGWTPDLDGDGNPDTASDDAIQAACDAARDYGMTIYAVGFSQTADDATLRGIARCGNGLYRKSSNTSELQMFYQDVVLNILEISRQSQSIVVSSGSPTDSNLYEDSYVLINHTLPVSKPEPNQIELVFQTPQFNGCEANITIPSGLRVTEAKVTSYSGEHWTSLVRVDNTTAFNLSRFAANYTQIGDPFVVQVPANTLTPGEHLITMATGDNDQNTTGCSNNNSLIYTGVINSSTSRSSVVESAEGCDWTVEFEDGTIEHFGVPQGYSGTKTCDYTNASHDPSLYTTDAYDTAVFSLLKGLDFDMDGRVFVNLAAEDLEIIVSLVSEVPYLWGPAIMGVEMWQ